MKIINPIIFSTDTCKKISPEFIGGKAYGLHELQKIHDRIPPWATITTEFFQNILENHSQLKDLLVLKKEHEIRQYIKSIIFNHTEKETLKDVWNKVSDNGKIAVAVRSSAVDEDNKKLSFAGQMDSFLQITSFSSYLQAIKDCWASLFGKRAVAYRVQNGIDPWKAKIAVIVQQMVPAEISGIIFTANPINNKYEEMLITSSYGLGEGLVSGQLDTDTYILDRKGKILNKEYAKKIQKIDIQKNGGTQINKIFGKDQTKSSLTDQQLQMLHKLSLRAEKAKNIPLDIEFSIYKSKIYFLQARPITSLKKKENLKIWDNSNIVESYSGVTTPLTFSFIKKAYFAVYSQFCETIGINKKTIFKNRHILENMLGLIQGHVYYNLLNWYEIVSLMPGFQYNKGFMEQMMGLQVIKELPKNPSKNKWNKYFIQLPRLIKVGAKILFAHFRLPKQINNFHAHFNQIYSRYSKIDYSLKTASEILSIYKILEDEILWKWRSPITNDFEAMIFYGLLKKLTIKWGMDPDGVLQNDLLSGEGDIQSIELITSLAYIAQEIENDKKLKNDFLNSSPAEALFKLRNAAAFSQIHKKFLIYIEKYGIRCINEMKLESIPMKDNPLFCISTIQNYLRNGVLNPKEQQIREQLLRKNAESTLHKKLQGNRRIIYKWVLKNCRKAIKNRENQRFARTQAYSLVRTLIQSIGKQWKNKNILLNARDIFYMEIDEIWSYIEGKSTCVNIKGLIELRKQEFKDYESQNPDDHIETENEVYFDNQFSQPIQESKTHLIKGLGCCSGVVENNVKVVLSPDENLQLNKEIMVAKQTDPGWGILFPSVSGLIIEKGSMLSHSAIVAREMGIPTVIGVKNATKIFSNGDRVILDGAKGTIKIVKRNK